MVSKRKFKVYLLKTRRQAKQKFIILINSRAKIKRKKPDMKECENSYQETKNLGFCT